MPYITTTTNKEITAEKRAALVSAYGRAITALGKGESYLMLAFTDRTPMAFGGKEKDCAMVEVDLFGRASSAQYDDMTARVCDIISDVLGIDGSCVYVKYGEVDHWGMNGFNF